MSKQVAKSQKVERVGEILTLSHAVDEAKLEKLVATGKLSFSDAVRQAKSAGRDVTLETTERGAMLVCGMRFPYPILNAYPSELLRLLDVLTQNEKQIRAYVARQCKAGHASMQKREKSASVASDDAGDDDDSSADASDDDGDVRDDLSDAQAEHFDAIANAAAKAAVLALLVKTPGDLRAKSYVSACRNCGVKGAPRA